MHASDRDFIMTITARRADADHQCAQSLGHQHDPTLGLPSRDRRCTASSSAADRSHTASHTRRASSCVALECGTELPLSLLKLPTSRLVLSSGREQKNVRQKKVDASASNIFLSCFLSSLGFKFQAYCVTMVRHQSSTREPQDHAHPSSYCHSSSPLWPPNFIAKTLLRAMRVHKI